MSDPDAGFTLRLHRSIAEISAADWDSCAGADNPFLSHAFLSALEQSGCVDVETGWMPQHAALTDEAGAVQAVLPLYLKSHSYGEYVFDHAWADAWARAGGRYYPKLQSAVPFTPVTGRRLLTRTPGELLAGRALISGAVEAARQMQVSSLHLTFCTEDEWRLMGEVGLLQRTGEQFHWHNKGYATFEDYLADLASRKRKQVRRERREVTDAGIEIELRQGRAIRERDWDVMFACYMDTGSRKWGQPYLNRRFFSLLGERLGDRVVLMLAHREGREIAAALNLVGADCLYGRYWGCLEQHACLHFELCYYQAIDYAIRHRLARVEAGAQGPHKLARGYLPAATYSCHWIADAGFARAVANYLRQERRTVAEEIEELTEHSPFRQAQD